MVLSVTSLKGGSGKSTVSQNLAVSLAHAGLKPVIVDADTNQSCLQWSSERPSHLPPVPVYGLPDGQALVANVNQLKANHDVIIIDGTPSLNKTTSRIIMVADFVIIPILPSQMDMWAAKKFVEHYWTAVETKGCNIPASFLINKFRKTTTSLEMQQILSQVDTINTFNTHLSDRIVYSKVVSDGIGVLESKDEKCKQEMVRFFNEVNETVSKIFN